jgi:hypothetical protein
MKDTLLLWPKQFLVSISPRIAAGGLKNQMWKSLPMLHNHGKFGHKQAVRKGILLLRPKKFLVPISTHITAV